jgi:predicted PurR-regulated permease PerM
MSTRTESQSIRLSPQGKLIAVALVVGLATLLISSIGSVLPPFIAAIITAYVFNPLVSWLQRRTNLSRALWIVLLYVLAFSLLSWLGTWLWPRIVRQYTDLVDRLPDIILGISEMFQAQQTIELGPGLTIDLTPLQEQLINAISDIGRTLSEGVPHLVFSALETLIYALVYLIVTFYLLLQSRQLEAWVVRLIPAPYRAEICGLGRQIDQVLGAYIRGQLLLVIIMSVLIYIPLTILNVPYALVIAVASGVLELIPILGPWMAATIAMIVAFFQPDVPFGLSNIGLAGLIGAIYFILRQIEDSFIIPNVVGHLVRLHPAVVIFAVLAGGAIAGPIGLLISIPTAAVLRIVLSYLYQKLTDTDTMPDNPSGMPPHTDEQTSTSTPETAADQVPSTVETQG